MAFRRETIKRQFDEAIPAVLDPGEQVQAGALSISGPSPWLTGVFGILFMLLLGMRYYFVAVTDRRVLFMKASMLSGRPAGLAFADQRAAVSISDVRTGKVWNSLRYHRPEGKPLRLNFHRIWGDEMSAIVQALGASALPPPPAG
jgi:hypothetical protein